ncbi:hypothetical protein LUZ61_000966 [Rhynchospora tenuis]|uniref:Uncharacterized protein n=1 Tax=Rhynchospora tenuis TaxID=198213 RepID=A0AAD5ZG12_9POAL|nr:hypothetical protein LUZ61_000966 [Rhynchospora tenuis]
MGLIYSLMDKVAALFLFISLLLFLPPLYLFKFINSFLSSRFPENLTNKVVLIVGASSGIGEHLAYEYAKRGALLVLVARRKNSLRDVAKMAEDIGSPGVLAIPADYTKPDECQRFIDTTIQNFGRLDHLVNVAGVVALPLFEEMADPFHFQALMDVNFWGPVYTTYFALPHLKRSRGRIVGVTSFSAYTNIPRMTMYNASKGAVRNFYHTLRIELGADIDITEIIPGVIESELTKGKIFTEEGRLEVDQDLRDASLGIVPIERTKAFAHAVVERVRSGARWVLEPPWYIGLYYIRVLIPEVAEWGMRLLYVTPPGVPATEDLAKKLADLPFVKEILYPPSVRSPEIKRD